MVMAHREAIRILLFIVTPNDDIYSTGVYASFRKEMQMGFNILIIRIYVR